MNRFIVAFVLTIFLLAGQVFAIIIHVPGDYPTIQQGIDAAGSGDIVMVAPGIYYEEISLKANVAVIGAGEGLSTIDGGGNQGDVVTAIGNAINNSTKFQGFTVRGAIYGGMPGGGGIFCNSGASPEICNNRVEGNSTGIATWNGAAPFIHNNVVIDNVYTGIDISSKPDIINNTVANNSNGMYDGGGYRPIIMDNVVTGNSNKGLGCINNSVPTDFSYNDVWGNGQNYYNCSPGPGDISANPLYRDEPNDDYHLQAGSPCIDSGNPAPAYNDPDGTRNDMGAYGGPGAAVITPQVSLTIPSQNELNILYNIDVSAVFTVDIDTATLSPLTCRLNGSLAGPYTAIVTYDSSAKMVTINPSDDFRCGEMVSAVLTKDIQSIYGDALAGYAWQFTAKTGGGSAVYAAPDNYGAANNPNAAVTADFNLDGDLDLGAVNENSDNVSILLGHGDGSFGPAANYAVGASPHALYAGDFDQDGDLDLATANSGSNNVSVLLGNGNGSFGAASNYSAGSTPDAICVGDFNLDGILDLAVANASSNNVSVLPGNGNGTFGPAVNYPVGSSPSSIWTGDFDKDGFLDLSTANSGSNNVSVLLGNNNGTFGSAANYSAGTSPHAVCAGDFDGDGDLDLAVANSGSNNVSALAGNGDGTFGTPTNHAAGTVPCAIVTSDFDGDGYLDLAAANGNSDNISVLLGNSNGSFGAAINYPCGDNPHSITGGDFDGDGDIDLCTANYNTADLSILKNENALQVVSTSPSQYQLQVPGSTIISSTFSMDLNPSTINASTVILFGTQTGLHLGAINYDSITSTATLDPFDDFIDGELVTAILTKEIQSSNGVYLKGFSWNFSTEITSPSAGTFADRHDYSTGIEPRGLYAGDLDGDADIDLAVTANSGYIYVFLNNGDGSFSNPVNYACSIEPIAVYGEDLDRDGDIDLAVINNRPGSANLDILENSGNGAFALTVTYTLAVMGNSISGADFDSDGDVDLILSSYWGTADNVFIMSNNGDATFSGPAIYTAGTWAHGVTAQDVDNDGDADIAVVNSGNDNVSILLNDDDGNFPDLANYPVGISPNSVYGNDLNGDGYSDFATANYGGDNITVILNNGNGTFSGPAGYPAGSYAREVAGGDFDGDGDIDLAVSINGFDSVAVLLNNGNGVFAGPATYQVGNSPSGIQSADFDRDGDLDIACANYSSNSVTILFNTGASVEEVKKGSVASYLRIDPNPFRGTAVIQFLRPDVDQQPALKIYDVTGRLVKDFSCLKSIALRPGAISWDGRDNLGRKLPAGIYFCRLETSRSMLTKQIVMIK